VLVRRKTGRRGSFRRRSRARRIEQRDVQLIWDPVEGEVLFIAVGYQRSKGFHVEYIDVR
jgi:hypothetical protein